MLKKIIYLIFTYYINIYYINITQNIPVSFIYIPNFSGKLCC